jgi:hypothetical protein
MNTVSYTNISDIIPLQWESWFWEEFSSNAPFSWGDNDITLITADRVLEHVKDVCSDVVDDLAIKQDQVDNILAQFKALGEQYISIDN